MAAPDKTPEQALEELKQAMKTATAQLRDVSDSIKVIPTIETYGRRTRKLSIAMVFTYVIDIILTVMLLINLNTTTSQSQQLRATQYQACVQGDINRAEQDHIWHELFTLSGTAHRQPGETAAQYHARLKILDKFLKDTDTAFAQVNCRERYLDAAGS